MNGRKKLWGFHRWKIHIMLFNVPTFTFKSYKNDNWYLKWWLELGFISIARSRWE